MAYKYPVTDVPCKTLSVAVGDRFNVDTFNKKPKKKPSRKMPRSPSSIIKLRRGSKSPTGKEDTLPNENQKPTLESKMFPAAKGEAENPAQEDNNAANPTKKIKKKLPSSAFLEVDQLLTRQESDENLYVSMPSTAKFRTIFKNDPLLNPKVTYKPKSKKKSPRHRRSPSHSSSRSKKKHSDRKASLSPRHRKRSLSPKPPKADTTETKNIIQLEDVQSKTISKEIPKDAETKDTAAKVANSKEDSSGKQNKQQDIAAAPKSCTVSLPNLTSAPKSSMYIVEVSPTRNKNKSPKTHNSMVCFRKKVQKLKKKKKDEVRISRPSGYRNYLEKGVFMVPLSQALKCDPREDCTVPIFVERLCLYIESYLLQEEGIFRKPGLRDEARRCRDAVNNGESVQFQDVADKHVMSSLLKLFLTELPEPVLTFERYDNFFATGQMTDEEARLSAVKKLIMELPKHRQHLLKRIVLLLVKTQKESASNLMDTANLSKIFAPCLLKCNGKDKVGAGIEELRLVEKKMMMEANIIAFLIEHYDDLFGEIAYEPYFSGFAIVIKPCDQPVAKDEVIRVLRKQAPPVGKAGAPYTLCEKLVSADNNSANNNIIKVPSENLKLLVTKKNHNV
eukprot:TRINITY_DN5172_c0_g1_i1.p1 TRINITY_DN5172_c0_g1~~TRINITY_DN5172_c0_g1_i1.p1  ORF type:complete len:618 (-),score=91.46 TRINITY_DN5172_c0_g1_i1:6-1859(-)